MIYETKILIDAFIIFKIKMYYAFNSIRKEMQL